MAVRRRTGSGLSWSREAAREVDRAGLRRAHLLDRVVVDWTIAAMPADRRSWDGATSAARRRRMPAAAYREILRRTLRSGIPVSRARSRIGWPKRTIGRSNS